DSVVTSSHPVARNLESTTNREIQHPTSSAAVSLPLRSSNSGPTNSIEGASSCDDSLAPSTMAVVRPNYSQPKAPVTADTSKPTGSKLSNVTPVVDRPETHSPGPNALVVESHVTPAAVTGDVAKTSIADSAGRIEVHNATIGRHLGPVSLPSELAATSNDAAIKVPQHPIIREDASSEATIAASNLTHSQNHHIQVVASPSVHEDPVDRTVPA